MRGAVVVSTQRFDTVYGELVGAGATEKLAAKSMMELRRWYFSSRQKDSGVGDSITSPLAFEIQRFPNG
jgi:hypothetical protein